MTEQTLVPAKLYLQTGSHIGAKFKSHGMNRFIFKKRRDKLKVLDVGTIDERLRQAAAFLARFPPEKIAVVSQKEYGQTPVRKFAEAIGAKSYLGRFVPGTFTNPQRRSFFEPLVLLVADPKLDSQAIEEAYQRHIPVLGLCSTDSPTKNIDLILPINNKGRQSLALAYWVLAREFLKITGKIQKEEEFTAKPEEYEFKLDGRKPERTERSREDRDNDDDRY